MAENEVSVYEENPDVYRKEITAVPRPEREIGIDTKKLIFSNIVEEGVASSVDVNSLNSFTSISRSRDQVYTLLDTMCQDSKVAAVLETYAEDATDTNDEGRIVWCEAADPQIQHYVTFLLDSLNIDKHIYKWVYSLCKYGDVYLRLYRESDVDDDELFSNRKKKKKKLTEAVRIKAYRPDDHYVAYVEQVPNPAQVFELVKHGKTYAYIRADIAAQSSSSNAVLGIGTQQLFQYSFRKGNVDLHAATDFVHASLEDNTSRTPETVKIFLDDEEKDENSLLYTVKRGQSLLYTAFKTWRELSLLENSLLLNRVTKSSIVRIISVEVGDMPKEQVGPHLHGIKSLIEQKSAINAGGSLTEYTNPGPVENNIYVPTHENVGTITTSEIGGNPDVKNIVDIEYYLNQFYGGLRVPKQYFGQTEDATGFNGGSSLSIISSRYAKMIKRIQNTALQMLYDLINLFLLDRKLTSYVNCFTLKMQAPTTQEELDRRENTAGKVQLVTDVMNMLGSIDDANPVKLKILKSLLSNVLTNGEVITLLDKEIEKMEAEEQGTATDTPPADSTDDMSTDDIGDMPEIDTSLDIIGSGPSADSTNTALGDTAETGTGGGEEQILPTPADMGVDLT